MPTWDEITPDTERWTRSSRLTCTNLLIGLNVAGFAISGIFLGLKASILPAAFQAPRAIGDLWVWQFLTYSFVQPTDWVYLLSFVLGAYWLYQLGNDLEREIGQGRYLALYLGSAAYGAMMHALYQYGTGSPEPAMSFLGPVLAVSLAAAWRNPNRPVLFFFVLPMRLRTAVLIVGFLAILVCVLVRHTGLSPAALAGAGVAALVFHYAEPALDRWLDGCESRRERARLIEGVELRHQVDQILEKISREGMAAVTRGERRILERASRSMKRDRERLHD